MTEKGVDYFRKQNYHYGREKIARVRHSKGEEEQEVPLPVRSSPTVVSMVKILS